MKENCSKEPKIERNFIKDCDHVIHTVKSNRLRKNEKYSYILTFNKVLFNFKYYYKDNSRI